MPDPPRRSGVPWVSASELGEYAYCPRAWWYREHPPVTGPTPQGRRATQAGQRFHARELDAIQRRESRGAAYAALLLVAAVLIGLGIWGLGLR